MPSVSVYSVRPESTARRTASLMDRARVLVELAGGEVDDVDTL